MFPATGVIGCRVKTNFEKKEENLQEQNRLKNQSKKNLQIMTKIHTFSLLILVLFDISKGMALYFQFDKKCKLVQNKVIFENVLNLLFNQVEYFTQYLLSTTHEEDFFILSNKHLTPSSERELELKRLLFCLKTHQLHQQGKSPQKAHTILYVALLHVCEVGCVITSDGKTNLPSECWQ